MMKYILLYERTSLKIIIAMETTHDTVPFYEGDVEYLEFATEAEMNAYIAEHNLIALEADMPPEPQ